MEVTIFYSHVGIKGSWAFTVNCSRKIRYYSPGFCLCCPQRELKTLVSPGIPAQFRGEVWRRRVYAKVSDIRDELGVHYYSHLVTKAHDSLVCLTLCLSVCLCL